MSSQRPNRAKPAAVDSGSVIGVSGAMRARDVARPSKADLAEAERDVVLVRRGWKPHSSAG
jgi:hypothetical protein